MFQQVVGGAGGITVSSQTMLPNLQEPKAPDAATLGALAVSIVARLTKINATERQLSDPEVLAEASKLNDELGLFPSPIPRRSATVRNIGFAELPPEVQGRLNPDTLALAQPRIEQARQRGLKHLNDLFSPPA